MLGCPNCFSGNLQTADSSPRVRVGVHRLYLPDCYVSINLGSDDRSMAEEPLNHSNTLLPHGTLDGIRPCLKNSAVPICNHRWRQSEN